MTIPQYWCGIQLLIMAHVDIFTANIEIFISRAKKWGLNRKTWTLGQQQVDIYPGLNRQKMTTRNSCCRLWVLSCSGWASYGFLSSHHVHEFSESWVIMGYHNPQ
jgi:hypothetical protein